MVELVVVNPIFAGREIEGIKIRAIPVVIPLMALKWISVPHRTKSTKAN
jgi:hypothetical protein